MTASPDWATPATTVVPPVALSWLGLVVHNVAEFGLSRLLGLETVGPTVVSVLLVRGLLTQMRGVECLLMGCAVLQLVGNYSSVGPGSPGAASSLLSRVKLRFGRVSLG